MKNVKQPTVSVHKMDVSRYNVLPGQVLYYQTGAIRVLFEVANDPKAALTNMVTIEPGSCLYLSTGITPIAVKQINKAELSWPTQIELANYRTTSTGI